MKHSVTATINAAVELPVPNIRELKANSPAVWQEVLSKAMAKDPHDPYPTSGDFPRDVKEGCAAGGI